MIEQGKTHLDFERLQQIAAFFKVTIEDLTNSEPEVLISNYQNESQFTVANDPKVISILEDIIANQQQEIAYLRKKLDTFF